MGKLKRLATVGIRKITGGKDPVRIVEDFVSRLGFSPEECKTHSSPENVRWLLGLKDGEELEILAEGLKAAHDTTIYLGINIITVPIRGSNELLAAALEIADGLIGIKVSLVGHYLVLSASLGGSGLSIEELEYHYKLISAQRQWFKDALAEELGWEQQTE